MAHTTKRRGKKKKPRQKRFDELELKKQYKELIALREGWKRDLLQAEFCNAIEVQRLIGLIESNLISCMGRESFIKYRDEVENILKSRLVEILIDALPDAEIKQLEFKW